MKTRITALVLAAVAALTLVPKPVQAGDKEIAAIGSFLGGLILGAAINESRTFEPPHETTIVVQDRAYGRRDDRGYWKTVTVRHWVPETWEIRYEHGRRIRVCIPGHYVLRRDRVWVAYERPHHHRRW